MIQNHLGEFAALCTAMFWTVTALAFHKAVNNVGSITVNFMRLFMAFFLLSGLSYVLRGTFFPSDAGSHQWIYLGLSGLVGFVFGDYTLFKSYEYIEARISMLMMALAPPFAVLIGWLMMGEVMTFQSLLGMSFTLIGIALVILNRNKQNDSQKKKFSFNYSIKGILYALGGAVGQGGGIVLSKYGMADYDAIAATHIRVIFGAVSFAIIVSLSVGWKRIFSTFATPAIMKPITLGAIFGPFLGVYFSLLAVKYTSSGIASTIMAIVPVLIIPPAIIIFKEKVTIKEVIGSVITVIGVMFFFLESPFLSF